MSENSQPETKKIPETAGIFKEKEKKDLEWAIRSELKKLWNSLTKKDILELMAAVETSKNLTHLKDVLTDKIPDREKQETIENILALAKKIREWALEWIKELELQVKNRERKVPLSIKNEFFFSHQYARVARLENSELGKNLILDITGAAIGVIDSIIIALKILLELSIDTVLLPKSIYNTLKKR